MTEIHAGLVSKTDDKLWLQMEEALLGLLDVNSSSYATDTEHLCPECVQLTVRLDLVRAAAHEKVERLMQRVMDAVGLLCVLEEESRRAPELFWERLLGSEMMLSAWDVPEDRYWISEVVNFTQAHGLHIVFSWERRPFQPYAAHAIGSFLQSPRRKYERLLLRQQATEVDPRLVRVALRFEDCNLTAHHLNLLMEALAVTALSPEADVQDVPLCGVYTLQALEFHSVILGFAELGALADIFTRRIDGLCLESTIQLTNSPKYIPAFKRVVSAALQSKHTNAIGSCCYGNHRAAMDTLSISLSNIVGEMIPRVGAALLASVPVVCQVTDPDSDLPPNETYQITSVRSSGSSFEGWMQISNPSVFETPTWVSSSSIRYLRIGDEDVVRCRFTRLVLHNDNYVLRYSEGPHHLGHLFGHSLEHLVLRNYNGVANLLPSLIRACPHLRALNFQDSRFQHGSEVMMWDALPSLRLEVINLEDCGISEANLVNLLTRLLEAPHKTLRFLNLWSFNFFDGEALDLLLRVLQETPTLELVEMPSIRLARDDPVKAALRRQLNAIDGYLHTLYLSPQIQLALMSVVRLREDLRWDEQILRNIFAFTGSRQKRVLHWDKREPEE